MSKKIDYIFIACVIVFVISLLVFIIQFIGKDSENEATITSGLLSFFGGAVGAIGAYGVAKHQINEEKKSNKINQFNAEYPVYIGLELEFKKIVEFLDREKTKNLIINREESQWDFYDMNEDTWEKKWRLSDPFLLKKIIEFQTILTKIQESYEVDIAQLNSDNRDSWNDKGIRKNFKIWKTEREKRQKIVSEIPIYYQQAENILKLLEQQIEKIQNIINGKNSPFDDNIYIKENEKV
ncbi:hypothetical protein [Lysinibacillus fusiformis]|uniref:hypothetical protein n=1 Tax=Lysinibacillus fusiformis TaxID=28031 RepID=UPI00263ACCA3|nr:hypothetical protein [Lysinibacillus fusiformis]MDC6268028.1 hypothetical protein [Lysinibacillus sphaericus]MDN4967482.1 hypothetical protein [Lysinibacillus fusiformis]